MDNDENGVIDSNYVDPNLLAQYDEEGEEYDSNQYENSTPSPTYIPMGDMDLLDSIFEQAIAQDASDIHCIVRMPTFA